MRYSFEFKMKCVELYRQGIWAETPEKVMKSSFVIKNKSQTPEAHSEC